MSHLSTIQRFAENPEALELTYQQVVRAGEQAAFAEAVETQYAESGANLLLAAWHYRLAYAAGEAKKRVIAWGWALPVGVLNRCLLWLLRQQLPPGDKPADRPGHHPHAGPWPAAAPISAGLIALFLHAGRQGQMGPCAGCVGWPGRGGGVRAAASSPHLAADVPGAVPELDGVTPGAFGLGRGRDRRTGGRRETKPLAFLVRSLEVFVVAGLLAIAGGLFTAITVGLFDALGIQLPDVVMRLCGVGGGGLIATRRRGVGLRPGRSRPREQRTDEGLSRLVALLSARCCPSRWECCWSTLAFIPFNWRGPIENRDVLADLQRHALRRGGPAGGRDAGAWGRVGREGPNWLRRGVSALAVLALLVSLYALAAIIYRTAERRHHPQPPGLSSAGTWSTSPSWRPWPIEQARAGRPRWLPAMHRTFAGGAVSTWPGRSPAWRRCPGCSGVSRPRWPVCRRASQASTTGAPRSC